MPVKFISRRDGYGCNTPGDMSGEYYTAAEVAALREALEYIRDHATSTTPEAIADIAARALDGKHAA